MQASILRFIEVNWHLGLIGDQSFDAQAHSLAPLSHFDSRTTPAVQLDPESGEPVP
jgi:phospholipase C